MNALLGEAGNPATVGDGVAMDWMGAPVASSRMPGLATRADYEELEAAVGSEADEVFTRLMIRHHAAGVAMANSAAAQGESDKVGRLSRGVARIQRAEIREMNLLRKRLGFEPIVVDIESPHGGHS